MDRVCEILVKKGPPRKVELKDSSVNPGRDGCSMRSMRNPVHVVGPGVLAISLGGGLSTIIDEADYSIVAGVRWGVRRYRRLTYAVGWAGGETVDMHRLILPTNDGQEVDHKDNDGLNNRRSNLRPVSHQQNMANRRPNAGSTSRFKGVSLCRGSWRAVIHRDGRQSYLGLFATEDEAARAYDEAAVDRGGEFEHLNFPTTA